MDEKIINDAMDNRFDSVEARVIVEELLELETKNKQLKEKLRIAFETVGCSKSEIEQALKEGERQMSKNGTASNEYMHESLKKDAVKYDLPTEEIVTALADDNKQLQAENLGLKELLQAVLPNVECKNNSQSRLITEIGEFLNNKKTLLPGLR